MKNTAAILGSNILNGFNGNNFDFNKMDWSPKQVGSLTTIDSNAPPRGTSNSNVTFIFQEGAIPVDARNKTTQEAKGLLTLALEGLDNITNIEVNGA